jgi:hypothetical protein
VRGPDYVMTEGSSGMHIGEGRRARSPRGGECVGETRVRCALLPAKQGGGTTRRARTCGARRARRTAAGLAGDAQVDELRLQQLAGKVAHRVHNSVTVPPEGGRQGRGACKRGAASKERSKHTALTAGPLIPS